MSETPFENWFRNEPRLRGVTLSGGPGGVVDGGSGGHGDPVPEPASDNDWTRTMASVNDAFAKDPAASVNVMLRTMAFTARQTGRSFLVRHEDNSNNVVWLYHLGGEADVIRIIHIENLYGEWLGLEPRAAAWPTTGEQFERLQREADEHIEALGREVRLEVLCASKAGHCLPDGT
jgi:hypothetical protein